MSKHTKEQQYSRLYGEYAPRGRYSVGDQAGAGRVIWRFARGGTTVYLVDTGAGWPREYAESELDSKRR